jgi:succinate-acetate transporter protein
MLGLVVAVMFDQITWRDVAIYHFAAWAPVYIAAGAVGVVVGVIAWRWQRRN